MSHRVTIDRPWTMAMTMDHGSVTLFLCYALKRNHAPPRSETRPSREIPAIGVLVRGSCARAIVPSWAGALPALAVPAAGACDAFADVEDCCVTVPTGGVFAATSTNCSSVKPVSCPVGDTYARSADFCSWVTFSVSAFVVNTVELVAFARRRACDFG